jgi:hypothetical protein
MGNRELSGEYSANQPEAVIWVVSLPSAIVRQRPRVFFPREW